MSEENLEKANSEAVKTEPAEVVEVKNKAEENTARILNENIRLSAPMSDDEAKRKMRSYSRRGFLIGGAAAVFGYLGYGWLRNPENAEIFTKTFRLNENLSQLYYSPRNLAPEFPKDQISPPRVNGIVGMSEDFNPDTWKLQVVGVANEKNYPQYTDNIIYEGVAKPAPPTRLDAPPPSAAPQPGLLLSLDDVKSLPRVEMTTELKCIEGWSVIVNWAGARFSDFAAKFQPQLTQYVSLLTPDGGYYVGWDTQSILHPQTLLAYEMNGAPLTLPHGAPLRLVSTMKYGIKQIKRIGRIEFTDTRPADFWAERGYDWYSGH